MRIDDLVMEESAVLIQANRLAAVSESRVDCHCALLAHWGLKKELAKVLAEDAYALGVGLARGLLDYLKDKDIERYRAIVEKLGLRR